MVAKWAVFTPQGLNNGGSKQIKMAGVNWLLEMSVNMSFLNGLFLQMLRFSVVEITKSLCVCSKTMCYFHSW